LKQKAKKVASVTAVVCVALAAAILVHQFIAYGAWFELDDFLHHENFALLLLAVAATAITLVLAG
jgi:hypothetical protein